MPVVFRHEGLRFHFYSDEGNPREPAHLHVTGGGRDAKVWLEPEVALDNSHGFNSVELRRILQLVSDRRDECVRAWNEHFGHIRPLRR